MKTSNNLFAIFIGIVLFLTSCSTTKISPWYNNTELVTIILDSSLQVYYRKADIPKIAKKVFEKTFSEDKILADSGDLFNGSDAHTMQIPNRRLIIGGKDKSNRCGYIVFETGGNTPYPTCIIYSSGNERKVKEVQMINFTEKIRDIQSFRNAIRNKKYSLLKGIGAAQLPNNWIKDYKRMLENQRSALNKFATLLRTKPGGGSII